MSQKAEERSSHSTRSPGQRA